MFPKLVVFDLDFTLWPFWIDTHAAPPPYRACSGGTHGVDSAGFKMALYPDVREIFTTLREKGIAIGVASRTGEPEWARQLMGLLTITDDDGSGGSTSRSLRDAVHFEQIFPGSKVTHFRNLARESGVALRDMLFFDDEHRNIRDVSALGVTCVLVQRGMSIDELHTGLSMWRQAKLKAGSANDKEEEEEDDDDDATDVAERKPGSISRQMNR